MPIDSQLTGVKDILFGSGYAVYTPAVRNSGEGSNNQEPVTTCRLNIKADKE